jgi:hypothetical protein
MFKQRLLALTKTFLAIKKLAKNLYSRRQAKLKANHTDETSI